MRGAAHRLVVATLAAWACAANAEENTPAPPGASVVCPQAPTLAPKPKPLLPRPPPTAVQVTISCAPGAAVAAIAQPAEAPKRAPAVLTSASTASAAEASPVSVPSTAPASASGPASGPASGTESIVRSQGTQQAEQQAPSDPARLALAYTSAWLAAGSLALLILAFVRSLREPFQFQRHWGGFGGSSSGWRISVPLTQLLAALTLAVVAGAIAIKLLRGSGTENDRAAVAATEKGRPAGARASDAAVSR